MVNIILGAILIVPSIYAEENVKIESIEIVEKSETTTQESEPNIDGLKIGLDLSFVDIGNSIKYKVVINNTTKKDYEIKKEKDFDTNDYIEYKYEFENGNKVKSNDKLTMYITVTYKNEISTESLTDGKYISDNNLVLNLENSSIISSLIKVPITGKNIWIAIILITILLAIIAFVIFKLVKNKKATKNISMLILSLLFIPLAIYAAEKLTITVTTKVTIAPVKGCYTFKNDSSGGGGNANMSGLTLMMKNASQGEDDESWFTDTAANQNQAGVYTRKGTSNDEYPIYYYRGAYTEVNNNLIFNNYCWKIVRTTSTGSIRIIYNGPAENNTCPTQTGESTMIGKSPFNNSYDDAKYVGYRYDNNGTMTDSNLKITLDNWYTANMSAVDSKVETSTYCNDKTTFGENDYVDISEQMGSSQEEINQITEMANQGQLIYYCPAYRMFKGTPTTKCKQASDAYNSKVGFLTVDEELLAGRSWNSGMQDYLYNGFYYWLGSPIYFDDGNAVVFSVRSAFVALYVNGVGNSSGVRPVVTLLPGASYSKLDYKLA